MKAIFFIKILYISIKSDNFNALEAQFEQAFPSVSVVKNKFRGEIAFLTGCERESIIRKKLDGFCGLKSVKILHTLGIRG